MEYSKISLEQLERNEKELVPRIFTHNQITILKKKMKDRKLDVNERTYYYKFIKPKLESIQHLFGVYDFVVNGREHMIEKRIIEAQKIIRKMRLKHKNKRMM